jgi:hypothetical protein
VSSHASVADIPIASNCLLEALKAELFPRSFEKYQEQVVLRERKPNRLAVTVRQAPLPAIEMPTCKSVIGALLPMRCFVDKFGVPGDSSGAEFAAPGDSSDARHEFSQAERRSNTVVGARVEGGRAIRIAGCEARDDDGNVRARSNFAQDAKTTRVMTGKREDDETCFATSEAAIDIWQS